MKRTSADRFNDRLQGVKRQPRSCYIWKPYSQLEPDRRIARLEHIRLMVQNESMNASMKIDLTDIIDALAAKEGGKA